MARHNIYLDAPTEALITELRLDKDGWSALFTTALTSHLATLPEVKVRRAVGRVGRQLGARLVDGLAPARDAG